MDIKPIETRYSGYRFRSRLEARWAVYFDALGIRWEYEKEGYQLPSGWYLPDFYLPMRKMFIEIKPGFDDVCPATSTFNIYLAGKMSGWRGGLRLRGHRLIGPHENLSHEFNNRGPHQSYRQDEQEIVNDCLASVNESDLILCWVDRLDTYATFVELGYAKSRGIRTYVVVSPEIRKAVDGKSGAFTNDNGDWSQLLRRHDLWFVERMATDFVVEEDPQTAFDRWFYILNEEEKKCLELCTGTGKDVWLFHGDPADHQSDIFKDGDLLVRNAGMGIHGYTIEQCREAARAARSARFEHGENGASR